MKNRTILLILTLLSSIRIFAQQSEIIGALNKFSFDIYKQLKSENENLFFSPISINIAMLMAEEGAKSDTKISFEKVLHNNTKENNKTLVFIFKLNTFKDSSNYIRISNAIWIQEGFKLNQDYKNTIQTKYLANAFNVNFLHKNESAIQINNWVAQKTNNLIKNIITPNQIDDSMKLFLSNAIYFIGKWDDEFNKQLTKKEIFYSIPSDSVKIDFLHKTEELKYYENNDFQCISKDYRGKDKTFCVILPKNRFGISSIETMLQNSLIDTIFKNAANCEVVVTLPKFKLETNYSLNEPLFNLGLKKTFTDDADFSGIATIPLKISNISHKAYFEIDEIKTKAVAVTGISISMAMSAPPGLMPKPKIFKADHPFVFMIIDKETKAIIFIGKFINDK